MGWILAITIRQHHLELPGRMHEVHVMEGRHQEAEAETGVAGGTELQEEGDFGVTAYAMVVWPETTAD